jgi:hypothetical protein
MGHFPLFLTLVSVLLCWDTLSKKSEPHITCNFVRVAFSESFLQSENIQDLNLDKIESFLRDPSFLDPSLHETPLIVTPSQKEALQDLANFLKNPKNDISEPWIFEKINYLGIYINKLPYLALNNPCKRSAFSLECVVNT